MADIRKRLFRLTQLKCEVPLYKLHKQHLAAHFFKTQLVWL